MARQPARRRSRSAEVLTLSDGLEGRPLRLGVQCESCCHEWTETVQRALVDPDVSRNPDSDWDGILLAEVVTCPICGERDRYQLTAAGHLALAAHAALAVAGDAPERVVFARAQTWDGEPVRRISEGTAKLERRTEREPDNGEAWRRLGNFHEKFGRIEVALDAWTHAIQVDEDEVEAAYSLTKHASNERDWFTFETSMQELLHRLPRADGDARKKLALGATDLLSTACGYDAPPRALAALWSNGKRADREVVANMSSVALHDIRDWDSVADFLARDSLIAARLTADIPDDVPTILERELAGRTSAAGQASRPARDNVRAKRKIKQRLARATRKKNR